ncbi:unnamed protein product [Microthlaspi erraticum]|uniref:Secreted protein n=1 Tax=Microthlaspi erraticum TaxID=1685480 RepID=A0A6D2L9V4_9BRAS|nr:unnamed protein product [Microthlaspi erraticum]
MIKRAASCLANILTTLRVRRCVAVVLVPVAAEPDLLVTGFTDQRQPPRGSDPCSRPPSIRRRSRRSSASFNLGLTTRSHAPP